MAEGSVHVPAKDIPVPASVSQEAQAILAMGPLGGVPAWPAADDVEAWKAMITAADEMVLVMGDLEGTLFHGMSVDPSTSTVEEIDVGEVVVYDVLPNEVEPEDRRVALFIHGGAFVFGAGEACRNSARLAARDLGVRTWSPDYRMPPDHPYPVALDDCLRTYRRLLEERRPDEIVVGGGSAGGNLAAALILRARDEGLPLPAAVVLETGAFDLTGSGDSFQTNLGLDQVLGDAFRPAIELYAGGAELRDPHVSPLFGDLTGFPPAILTTGTRDLLLSDSVRMHRALRAAGADAELHVWEAGSHGLFFGSTPEDADKVAEVRRFIAEHCASA